MGPRLRRVVEAWPRIDRALYPLLVALVTLFAAKTFYASMRAQTHGVWSAPLDDVFIHFDYARATARGYPFQWSEGNGFSSGNTSLTYPFALALGYWIGFRGLLLMQWAAIVALVSVFAFFLVAKRFFEPLGAWAKYLLPPVVLSLGALNWSLWSGMENAFHLGVWALALAASTAIARAGSDRAKLRARGWLAGLAGALLFATRPESAVCVAAMGVWAALAVRKGAAKPTDENAGNKEALATLVRVGLPGAIALVVQAIANKAFTGEWAANGAITKLAFNNPFMSSTDKWNDYVFNLKYVVLRNTQHHFSDVLPWGWLVPAIALVPLFCSKTRAAAIFLWFNVAAWLALVAMNGQVRWQNERYTMPAVAWLLVLAALGLAVIFDPGDLEKLRARSLVPRVAIGFAACAAYWIHQAPNFRDQVWFFGRACRNIHDQHVVAGEILRKLGARRVLVGDAGALIYASDRPGLDLIGLGGYHDLPFARAGVHGLGASLELIERLPAEERPDFMAIYPSWWGDLPTLFGKRVTGVEVVGNVICGGAEKGIYHADWSALDRGGSPRDLGPHERVVDSVDVADLVSEREHAYEFPHPGMGFTTWRVLADPIDDKSDLFDAGREIPEGQRESMRMRAPRGAGRLLVRTATPHAIAIEALANGRSLGTLATIESQKRGWSELSLSLPADLPSPFTLELVAKTEEVADYHVWILEGGSADDSARGKAAKTTAAKAASSADPKRGE